MLVFVLVRDPAVHEHTQETHGSMATIAGHILCLPLVCSHPLYLEAAIASLLFAKIH